MEVMAGLCKRLPVTLTAASVDVRRHDGNLRLAVIDNGAGFSQSTLSRSVFPRFGLSTMRERAESIGATFTIESAPGGGTSVYVDIPLSAG